jgi:hypothetical protein
LDCFFTDNDIQEWAFHIPKYLTFNEALTYGTQEVISHYYEQITGRKPDKKSRIQLTVSSKEIQDSTTALMWMYEDPLWEGANYFVDQHTRKDVWLCPYLPLLFGEAPKFLWVNVVPTV